MSRQIPSTLRNFSNKSPSTGIPHPDFERSGPNELDIDISISRIIPTQQPNQPGPGILTVTLHQGVGLSAPDQSKEAFNIQQHESITQSDGSPGAWHSYLPCRKQFLPYAILCFDQSQVFVGSIAGTTENPIWAEETILWKFDVSRASELTVHLYLKNPNVSQGGQDISLGVVRIIPAFEEENPFSLEWLDVQEGTGRVRIGVEYLKNKSLEIGDVEHAYFYENGQYGEINAWRKKDTRQVYALKTIRTADVSPSSAILHSLRFRINSPFIAPLIFASQSPRGLYLFSPFVTGGHLFYYLQRDQCFDIDRSRFYAAEILSALDHLHNLDISYHGMGRKNIILDSFGHIVIVDLGLFLPEAEDEEGTGSGASQYPAPETLLGQDHSKASDWWTLGVFLHEMLTGLPPFYDESVDETHRKILSEPLQLPGSLSPSAKGILSKLLKRNPEERLGAKGAFEIKAHPFFIGVDWDKLTRREYKPTFKPHLIATFFREKSCPRLTRAQIQQQFVGWEYKRPPGSPTLTGSPNKASAPPSKQSIAAEEPISPDVADSPRPSSAPQVGVDDDLAWELVWEEAAQVFLFYNHFTNTKQPINSRGAYPKSACETQKPLATRTTLEDHSAIHDVSDHTDHNVPTQAQKEDVLEAALKANCLHVIPQLLDRYGMNLNIHVPYRWQTPLEWATEHENLDLIKLFLDYGADPSFTLAREDKNKAALTIAVEKRNQELVEILVQRTDRVLCTRALGFAVDRKDAGMVTVLLANHVKCDFEESDRPRPAHPNEGCFFFDISLPDEFIPPLVRAVKLDNLELVRLLLAHGADANVGFHTLHWQEIREPDGLIMHPSMYCGRVVQLAMDLGRRDMVRVLLEAGADIGMGQPVWKHHECMMMPMEDYFRILDGLRREAGAVKK